jgi:hypothetical protein
MNPPDAKTRKANRRILAGIAVFAVFLCALVIVWKTFFT